MERSHFLETRRTNTIPLKWFLGLEGLLCGGFVVFEPTGGWKNLLSHWCWRRYNCLSGR